MRAAPPADSRLGALQRGRGAGARAVLASLEDGIPEVIACVLDDPRVDRQVEARDDYYAALLVAGNADPKPIAEHLRTLASTDTIPPNAPTPATATATATETETATATATETATATATATETATATATETATATATATATETATATATATAPPKIIDDSPRWLPAGVLARMARRGSLSATTALRELLRDACAWRTILLALDAAGGPALLAETVDADTLGALIAHVSPNDLLEATREIDAPWATWAAAVPALRFVLRRQGEDLTVDPRPAPIAWVAAKIRTVDLPDLNGPSDVLLTRADSPTSAAHVRGTLAARTDPDTTRALLDAAHGGPPLQRDIALGILGTRGHTDFLEEAEQALRAEAAGGPAPGSLERRAWFRYLDALPAAVTLPLARAWLDEPWPLSRAAESILAEHAEAEDRARIEAAIDLALRHDLVYRLCSLVDALGHIGEPASLDVLSTVYQETRYSYARRRAIRALMRHADDARAQPLLCEALWDCEVESRELACRAVDRDAIPARSRLRDLAADPYEDPDVRIAADEHGGAATRRR